MATVTVRGLGNYQMLMATADHGLISDEPKGVGDGLGPNPYDLLLGALGTCTGMTVLMYARRKGWPLENVSVGLSHERIHAEDCEDCEEEHGLVERINVRLEFEGDLSAEQRERLAYIATRCPVHKTLQAKPRIMETVAEP